MEERQVCEAYAGAIETASRLVFEVKNLNFILPLLFQRVEPPSFPHGRVAR